MPGQRHLKAIGLDCKKPTFLSGVGHLSGGALAIIGVGVGLVTLWLGKVALLLKAGEPGRAFKYLFGVPLALVALPIIASVVIIGWFFSSGAASSMAREIGTPRTGRTYDVTDSSGRKVGKAIERKYGP